MYVLSQDRKISVENVTQVAFGLNEKGMAVYKANNIIVGEYTPARISEVHDMVSNHTSEGVGL